MVVGGDGGGRGWWRMTVGASRRVSVSVAAAVEVDSTAGAVGDVAIGLRGGGVAPERKEENWW